VKKVSLFIIIIFYSFIGNSQISIFGGTPISIDSIPNNIISFLDSTYNEEYYIEECEHGHGNQIFETNQYSVRLTTNEIKINLTFSPDGKFLYLNQEIDLNNVPIYIYNIYRKKYLIVYKKIINEENVIKVSVSFNINQTGLKYYHFFISETEEFDNGIEFGYTTYGRDIYIDIHGKIIDVEEIYKHP